MRTEPRPAAAEGKRCRAAAGVLGFRGRKVVIFAAGAELRSVRVDGKRGAKHGSALSGTFLLQFMMRRASDPGPVVES